MEATGCAVLLWNPWSPGDLMGPGNVPQWTAVLKVILTGLLT